MADLNEAFLRRERDIAREVAADADLAVRLDITAVRRRRGRLAGLSAGAAGAVGAVIAGAFLFMPDARETPVAQVTTTTPSATVDSEVSPSPTLSASATPSPSPSPSPSAPAVPTLDYVDGFAPVKQWPSSEIPWAEVGPGWNLVSYASLYTDGAGLSLIAPDGTWYAARQVEGSSPMAAFTWDGVNAWVTDVPVIPRLASKPFSLLDVKTGASAGNASVSNQDLNFLTAVEPGVAATYIWNLGTAVTGITGPGAGVAESCDINFGGSKPGEEAGNPRVLYLPGNGVLMVCMVADDDGHVVVTLINTSTGATTALATLSGDWMTYTLVGWIDEKSFYFAEHAESVWLGFKQVHRFTMASTPGGEPTIEPIVVPDLPLGSSDNYSLTFDRHSGRFIVKNAFFSTNANNATLSMSTLDGGHIATVNVACYNPVHYTTGGFLVAWCPALNTFTRWNLSDGAAAGTWSFDADAYVKVAGFPDP